MSKRKLNDLSLADKAEVIKMKDQRMSQIEISKKYGCSQSQISRIITQRQTIMRDYTENKNLHNVKLVFLPPNTTSLIQPCDIGIIRSIKHNYRKNMVSRIISEIDDAGSELSATTLTKAVTLLDAVHMLRSAWAAVTTSTVINCFGKAGFRKTADVDPLPDPTVDEPPPNMSHV